MESLWSVSKLSTESVGSRRQLVANCVHTADATKQFRRVGGVYTPPTRRNSTVSSRRRCVLGLTRTILAYVKRWLQDLCKSCIGLLQVLSCKLQFASFNF